MRTREYLTPDGTWTGKAKPARLPMRLMSRLTASVTKRTATLARKNEAAIGESPAQLPECPDLVAPQRMNARLAILDAADMQGGRPAELDLRPFQVTDFGGSQPMPQGD
jgi:hypothetical protein